MEVGHTEMTPQLESASMLLVLEDDAPLPSEKDDGDETIMELDTSMTAATSMRVMLEDRYNTAGLAGVIGPNANEVSGNLKEKRTKTKPTEFIANEGAGEVPLEGSIPDITSYTEHYVCLQKIYHAKAEADFLAMEQRTRNILKKIGRDPNSITKMTIKSLCLSVKTC